MRFVVTGSGRCGTKYMANLLTAAGIACGHERVFDFRPGRTWGDRMAESSWMAVPSLSIPEPVVLLVRHPLKVVKSWVEIGMFGWQLEPGDDYNPCHDVLRPYAPWVYEFEAEQDRALASWIALTEGALPFAEMVVRIESFDEAQFGRLLAWAGGEGRDTKAFRIIRPTNKHKPLRRRTGVTWQPSWDGHNQELAARARRLAALFGLEEC